MTLEEMIAKKKEYGYTYGMIADMSGLPLTTVQKVLGGITKTPRFETLQALERVFKMAYESKPSTASIVAEPPAAYGVTKKQGEYTLKDYYALPEDVRAELIDGVLYDMAAPDLIHQALAGAIHSELLNYVLKKKGACMPFISPIDVQLDQDNRTMIQTDVIIVCDRSKLIRRCVYGAPDFVVEILSPSTKKKDLTVKMKKYMDAGVKEYWTIWPEQKKVVVYPLNGDLCPVIYTFDMQVPVGIWDGECKVDFPVIMEQISFLYESED